MAQEESLSVFSFFSFLKKKTDRNEMRSKFPHAVPLAHIMNETKFIEFGYP